MLEVKIELLMKSGDTEALPEDEVKDIVEMMKHNIMEALANDPDKEEMIGIFRELCVDVQEFVIRVKP